ncbi:MAG: hypothetical protein ACO3YU_04405 [Candidatus Nanopelagicales bacterium]
MHRLAALREVQEKGARAQAERANELLAVLQVDALDPAATAEADALIEAYLHDPYLTKNAGD